jgi:hypothetical protein
MHRSNVLERHVGIQRKFEQRGASTGEKKEGQSPFIARAKEAKDDFAGTPAIRIGQWMASEEILKIRERGSGAGWCNDHTSW